MLSLPVLEGREFPPSHPAFDISFTTATREVHESSVARVTVRTIFHFVFLPVELGQCEPM